MSARPAAVQTSASCVPLLGPLFIPGHPVAQPRPRARVIAGTWGAPTHAGVYDPGDAKAWRELLAVEGQARKIVRGLFQGPVRGRLRFQLARAPRDAGRLWPREDLDNLQKAALDAWRGILYGDDAQIVGLDQLEKCYADQLTPAGAPGLHVELWGVLPGGGTTLNLSSSPGGHP